MMRVRARQPHFYQNCPRFPHTVCFPQIPPHPTEPLLGIFGQRAQTREARLQVELASLVHQKSRLVRGGARRAAFEAALAGRAGIKIEVVSARQRGRSGAGEWGGGGGERLEWGR